jgi:membrane protein implicated in regulation of membrane protease activity
MTWANFYLVCFLVGFLLSLCSLLLGSLHIHLPHAGDGFHLHIGDGAGHVAGHAAGHAIHGVGHAVHGAGQHAGGAEEIGISPVNFGTIAAFLAWFGGSGYLLARWSPFWSLFGLVIATGVGLAGSAIVFLFLVKLSSPEENLDPADYDMVGVVARVSSGIRAGGTGEIVYSQEGTRRASGARSDDGGEIPKGVEVVVTRYEKGIAYVERWEKLAEDEGLEAGPADGAS